MAPRQGHLRPICPRPTGLVHPVPLDPTGRTGPTRGQAAGPRWRQTSHGLYVPADVDAALPEQRIVEQAARLWGGAVTGWASCRMHRAGFFDGLMPDGRTPIPVPLGCGPLHQIRKQPGDDLIRDKLFPPEIVWLNGVPCTVRRRALFDAMRYAEDTREAAVAMDNMAAAELVSIRQMQEYVDEHPAWTGVQRARDALLLADENSRSPNETRMRLIWRIDAGLPPPLVNRPVFDLDGRLIGIPDLFDPDAGVAAEYDGEDHRRAGRHSGDVDREGRFRDHHLEIFRVTGPDMPNRERVVRRMHATYARANWVPEARRTWTLTLPPWWDEEPGLDARLILRELEGRPFPPRDPIPTPPTDSP